MIMIAGPQRHNGLAALAASPRTRFVALLALCAAYLQGRLTKLFDFHGAIAEMDHFGLSPAALFAVAVIVLELAASAMILSGFCAGSARWRSPASRFWRPSSPSVSGRCPPAWSASWPTNSFFEHLGLSAASSGRLADLTKGAS